MKILFLNSARGWGGNEKWTRMAAGTLSGRHGVLVAFRSEQVGRRFGVERIRLPFIGEWDLYTLARLIHIVSSREIDVLVPTKPKEYVLAGIVAKLLGRKNVIRLGIDRRLGESFVKDVVYNRLADGIIVNAQSVMEGLLESSFMRAEKIEVIRNGIDGARIDNLSKEKPLHPLPFPFMFCSVGEVSRRKGSADVLAGFARFMELSGANDAGLLFVGSGDERRRLERAAREAGLDRHVLFTGFVENPYPFVRSCDAFVSCSKSEGIANALLEAMYLQCAVIVTPAGGTAEVVRDGENGLIAGGSDAETIGSLMMKVYRDGRLRGNIARQARRTIEEDFSLEAMGREIENFLCRLVGKDGVQPVLK